MAESCFHPVVQEWFRARFGAPTEPQKRGWPEIAAGRDTLIAAPTGSGKTLAAFLVCIDQLLRQGLEGGLPDLTQVVYVSPLKALSNDVRRNLESPLAEIQDAAMKAGLLAPPIRAQVRTGDTPASERAAMLKRPPHILVTTPESLYLLLTSERSRKLLGSVRTVIVDEIHALARDKRGSHLALSLERLEALRANGPTPCARLQRIGLSATQKPIQQMARFLTGAKHAECRIIDTGYSRKLDLGIETTDSELAAVCANEQWDEVYEKLVALISSHRSTLVFVNTRRMAERISHRLRERLGENAVASHHGSLSREIRLSAEDRLKRGELKAIVATASLELGIDVGFIDLVCQIGSPRSIATFLQRIGRSGHRLGVVPKGRLFALTRDELFECMALLRSVRQGRLDAVEIPTAPLDILAQQVVAEVSAQEWDEDALFERFRAAWPYRDLERAQFDRVLTLVSEGIAKGRKEGAYVHRDLLNHKLRARRAARLTAITSGGAIPETADYRVVTETEGTFIGTVNEDFAIESLSGDVFLLGNTSWRIRYIRGGQVVVTDAQGAPATIPFWLGDAPGRTVELSAEVSELREKIAELPEPEAARWLISECGANEAQAREAAAYAAAQKAAVGFVPTQKKILFERFFDESGGMQLVIHSPYGTRINRAWGLALRKRFCRTFDFELQASADDNGIVLSLGPQHSFPVEQMFHMLNSKQGRDVLVQALLAAPMFQVRWRWNISRALAVLRTRGGKKVPPPLQRFKSDDLLTAVFPMQTACFEHRPPDLEVPHHPLVEQTVHDCLYEAMDVARWEKLLSEIEAGRVELVARDTREPSPFSHAILNANPYSFLDDAPLEERRARAVATRRTVSIEDVRDLAKLDPDSIARVRAEARPLVRDAEELHDVLLSLAVLPAEEGADWAAWFETLRSEKRAILALRPGARALWAAAETWPIVHAAFPDAKPQPEVRLPPSIRQNYDAAEAVAAIVRGRLEISGPVTVQAIAHDLELEPDRVARALETLEAEGFALQGRFEGPGPEWCERRLLARIHRLTLEGARRRVQPVPPETYWRFLAEYHHMFPESRREGRAGLYEAVGQLQGFDLAAGAWESEILPGRVEKYQPEWLDTMSFSGELVWSRLKPPRKSAEVEPSASGSGMTRVAPVSLAFRSDLPWLLGSDAASRTDALKRARSEARAVYETLERRGALFFDDLAEAAQLPPAMVEDCLSELAALGVVTSDGFSALRRIVTPARSHSRPASRWSRARGRAPYARPASGGRWTLFPGRVAPMDERDRLHHWAWQLLRRYGIVFRDLLARETAAPAWWQLVPVFRQLEARGEALGGRYVSGVGGEQYALAEAVESLRRAREGESRWLVISAADPLNLAGIITQSPRVPATRANRLLLIDGRLTAVYQGGETQFLAELGEQAQEQARRALRLQLLPPRDALLKP